MSLSWSELLNPKTDVSYSDIRREIERGCKEILSNLDAGEHMSTSELVEKIWPIAYCKGEDVSRRKRLYTWLSNQTHPILPSWRRRGVPRKIERGFLRGKIAQPWEWLNGEAEAQYITCPNCGCERKITKT